MTYKLKIVPSQSRKLPYPATDSTILASHLDGIDGWDRIRKTFPAGDEKVVLTVPDSFGTDRRQKIADAITNNVTGTMVDSDGWVQSDGSDNLPAATER